MNSTEILTNLIQKDESFVFIKYGDGEVAASQFEAGGNCDGTVYTQKLGEAIAKSIHVYSGGKNIHLASMSKPMEEYWEKLIDYKPIWSIYQTINIDNFESPDKANLYKAIKTTNRRKIFIGNFFMLKVIKLLNIDVFIPVDAKNWFDTSYEFTLRHVESQIFNDSNTMIITSAGMGAKPLLADLYKKYPNAIYIDAGSAFDLICTKRHSRAYHPQYNILRLYLNDVIPSDWEDSKWDYLNALAKHFLG
jgi:hypothetical protein